MPTVPTYAANGAVIPSKTADADMDMEENDDDDGNDGEAQAPEEAAPVGPPIPRPTNVQILDLHTFNPLVAYDGHVYSCQWAENVGTEMLFKPHDPKDNSLPGIRTLPGGVDLIAMSSARIVSQSMQVKRMSEVEAPRPSKRPQGNMKSLKIQVGNQALQTRKDKATFLQKLAEMKERRGEEDLVTIHTKARPKFKAWVQALQTKRKREREQLVKIVEKGGAEDEEVQSAQKRIEEIDAETERLNEQLESKGLHPDGKRRAKLDDARTQVGKTNRGLSVPKTNRVPIKRKRPRKVTLLKGVNSFNEALDGDSDADSDEDEGSFHGDESSDGDGNAVDTAMVGADAEGEDADAEGEDE